MLSFLMHTLPVSMLFTYFEALHLSSSLFLFFPWVFADCGYCYSPFCIYFIWLTHSQICFCFLTSIFFNICGWQNPAQFSASFGELSCILNHVCSVKKWTYVMKCFINKCLQFVSLFPLKSLTLALSFQTNKLLISSF